MDAVVKISDKMPKIAYLNSRMLEANSDQTLFEKVKGNDEGAFETLFRMYYPRLCVYAQSIMNNAYDAEEVVQNAFVKIWERKENISLQTSFKSYIYQAVKNNCLTLLRDQKKTHSKLRVINKMDENLNLDHGDGFDFELYRRLEDAIELLPEQCKRIFIMSRINGLKHKEIADDLGLKVKTVENQIGIALKKLRSIFFAMALLVVLTISNY